MKNYLTRRNEGGDLFGLNFFDDEDFFAPFFYGKRERELMKTDVKEKDGGYELKIDMPGYDKKDLKVTLDKGYLTVAAKREEKEEDKKYIRRERSFSCSRSYFVGEKIQKEDIKAKYENGTLELFLPKEKEQSEISHDIEIL